MAKDKPNYTPNNPKRSGPQESQPAPARPSKQFGPGQKQPHSDGRGQSGKAPRR